MLRPIATALCLFGLSGCCFDPSRGGTGGGGSSGSGGGGGRIEDVKVHEQCVGNTDPVDFDAALTALDAPPIQDGLQELKASPSGCIVVQREYEGGALRGVALRRFAGYATIIDGGVPNFVFGEAQQVFFEARYGADGHNVVTVDRNGDHKIEKTFDEQFSQGKLSSRVVTLFNEATGTIFRRSTLTPSTTMSGMMSWRIESGSPLAVTTDLQVPAGQKQQTPSCYSAPSNPNDDTEPCPISEADIRKKLHTATLNFWKCLKDLGGSGLSPSFDEIFQLRTQTLDNLGLRCFKSTGYAGQMHLDTNVLDLNVALLGSCEQPSYVDSTIIHELMHRLRGPHDADWTSLLGPIGPRARAGADPAYACEALCFGDGTLRNKCSCARCLNTRACDERCDLLPSCKFSPDGGMATASEAVGTLCRSNNTWFFTRGDCNAAGACPQLDGKSACRSYSVSCDPTCN